jgi:hypothetical protein
MTEMQAFAQIVKTDEERQLIWAEVYAPMVPDSQGDFMTAEGIEKIAYDFMKNGHLTRVDTNHDLEENGSVIVESFVARKDDPDFTMGSWVVGMYIPDVNVWKMVKDGRLNGYSMYGKGRRVERVIELEIPDSGVIKGTVQEHDDGADKHYHEYTVKFDAKGKFLGGETGPAIGGDGSHVHSVMKGTATEPTNGHNHRFSFLEGVSASEVESVN